MNVARLMDSLDVLFVPLVLAFVFALLWLALWGVGRVLVWSGIGGLVGRIVNRKFIRFEKRRRFAEREVDRQEAHRRAKLLTRR